MVSETVKLRRKNKRIKKIGNHLFFSENSDNLNDVSLKSSEFSENRRFFPKASEFFRKITWFSEKNQIVYKGSQNCLRRSGALKLIIHLATLLFCEFPFKRLTILYRNFFNSLIQKRFSFKMLINHLCPELFA